MGTLKIISIIIVSALVFGSAGVWAADADLRYGYVIVANFGERSLSVFEISGDTAAEIKKYPIAVPTDDQSYPLPVTGKVAGIEFDPFWYPTEATRKAYFGKKGIVLPDVIGPGDPRNAMGKVKILIDYDGFSLPIRIHGTNEPSSIGKKVSRGCIRMHNADALELARLIKNARTKVILAK